MARVARSATRGRGALLKSLKIQGTDTELQAFSQRVGGHPLALKLVAGLLNEEEGPNPLLSRLKDRNLFQIEGLHRGEADVSVEEVLEESFNRLTDKLKLLLLNSSVYRRPFNQAAAVVQLPGEEVSEQDLRQLAKRSLLQELRDQNWERLFQFHPFILTYVQQKTGDQTEAHEQAIHYYQSIATDPPWNTQEDVVPYLEIFYHRYKLKQYVLADDVLKTCAGFLDRSGYDSVRVALNEQLVQEW